MLVRLYIHEYAIELKFTENVIYTFTSHPVCDDSRMFVNTTHSCNAFRSVFALVCCLRWSAASFDAAVDGVTLSLAFPANFLNILCVWAALLVTYRRIQLHWFLRYHAIALQCCTKNDCSNNKNPSKNVVSGLQALLLK